MKCPIGCSTAARRWRPTRRRNSSSPSSCLTIPWPNRWSSKPTSGGRRMSWTRPTSGCSVSPSRTISLGVIRAREGGGRGTTSLSSSVAARWWWTWAEPPTVVVVVGGGSVVVGGSDGGSTVATADDGPTSVEVGEGSDGAAVAAVAMAAGGAEAPRNRVTAAAVRAFDGGRAVQVPLGACDTDELAWRCRATTPARPRGARSCRASMKLATGWRGAPRPRGARSASARRR